MGVCDGESVGGSVDARVKWYLRRRREITVDHLSAQIDDRHHLRRHHAEIGSGRGHGDQVPLTGRDVTCRADHETLLGQMAAGARYGLSFTL